jgi:hypothetical protein
MSSVIYRFRNAKTFTQLCLESYAVHNRWARRLLGGKWEQFPSGEWFWVNEFGFDNVKREEFEGFRLKMVNTRFNEPVRG